MNIKIKEDININKDSLNSFFLDFLFMVNLFLNKYCLELLFKFGIFNSDMY